MPEAFINFDPIDENDSSDKEKSERNALENTLKLDRKPVGNYEKANIR